VNGERTSSVLTWASAGGWLREGKSWQVAEPFYALLGEATREVLTPGIQRAAMRARGLAATYLSARISASELSELKAVTWPTNLLGFNVTPVLGEEAAGLCDRLTEPAQEIGVVDTVRVDGDRWFGHNTSVAALQAVVSQVWPDPVPPVTVTVLGAGDSIRATVSALAHWGVENIVILCQGVTNQHRLRDWLDREWLGIVSVSVADPEGDVIAGEELSPRLCVVSIPVGADLAPYLSGSESTAPELIVDPRCGSQLQDHPSLSPETTVIGGEPLLVLQCGFSFVWWFGPPVPWDDMRRAISL